MVLAVSIPRIFYFLLHPQEFPSPLAFGVVMVLPNSDCIVRHISCHDGIRTHVGTLTNSNSPDDLGSECHD